MSRVFLTDVDLSQNTLLNAIIHPLDSAPENPVEGQIYTNSSDKILYIYLDNTWKTWIDTTVLGVANGVATLDQDALVIQDPKNAQDVSEPFKIPKADLDGKISNQWLHTGSGNELDADQLDGHEWTDIEDLLDGKYSLHGFTYPYDANLTYDKTTRTITVSPKVSAFSFWIDGIQYVKSTPYISVAHPNTTGQYFFTFNYLGEIEVSSTPWDLQDLTRIPVCVVYYNQNIADGFANYELHKALRNVYAHRQSHFSIGTFVKNPSTNFSMSGYTLNTGTNAGVTFSLSSGSVMDEDIEWVIPTLADGGPYTILYRVGANEWRWTTNNTVPYHFNTNNNIIQFNQLVNGSYVFTNVGNNNFVNYYIFATTALETVKQIFIVPGQAQYTSQTAAEAENLSNLSFANTVPLEEFAPIWKMTIKHSPSNNNTGSGKIASVSKLSGTRASVTLAGASSSHNSLSGRSDPDCHPATAISNAPSGTISSTTVQGALNELDGDISSKAPLIPSVDNTVDLGTSLLSFKHIYTYDLTVVNGTGGPAYFTLTGELVNPVSDRNLKTNIEPLKYGLDDVLNLEPVSFNWKNTNKYGKQNEIGLIAQDVENICPELVGENKNGELFIDYPKIVNLLIKAIQDLNDKIDQLQDKINE